MAVLGRPSSRPPRTSPRPSPSCRASGILIGEGVKLTQATPEGLEALPGTLRIVAIRCTPSLMALIDLGSRIRGCIERSNDGAGEAAAQRDPGPAHRA